MLNYRTHYSGNYSLCVMEEPLLWIGCLHLTVSLKYFRMDTSQSVARLHFGVCWLFWAYRHDAFA